MLAGRQATPSSRARVVLLAVALVPAGCSATNFDWRSRAAFGLDHYQRAFARDLGSDFVSSATWPEFVGLLRHGSVLWLGDHHRDVALHRQQRRLLQRLQAAGFVLALGLEGIGTQDEPAVARYLAGQCSLDDLAGAQQRRWPEGWLASREVDSAHYRQLLATARAAWLPVFALEPAPRLPLEQRDAVIAAAVRAAAARHPDRLLVVVVGQAHLLGAGRLPERVGLPGVALGAEPSSALRAATPARAPRGGFLRCRGGLWFFVDLLPERGSRGARGDATSGSGIPGPRSEAAALPLTSRAAGAS